jgi:hypothetical protein
MKIQAMAKRMLWAVVVMSVARGGLAAPAKALPESSSADGVGLTAKVGTLGLGAEVTLGLNDYVGVRLGGNQFNYSESRSGEDGTVYGDLELLTYSALLDIHPFGEGFRLSGGAMLNKNRIKLSADVNKTVELDGQEYWLSDLEGAVTFNEMAPYAGIGYGNAVGADGRWHFSCDFGVMFQGSPKVDASATASDPEMQPVVDEALAKEEAKAQDDAEPYKYYPVISIGLSYRF